MIVECDGCEALVHPGHGNCPGCGEPLDIPSISSIGSDLIPITRYGTVPPPPDDIWVMPPARRRRRRRAMLMVAGLAVAGVSAWARWSL